MKEEVVPGWSCRRKLNESIVIGEADSVKQEVTVTVQDCAASVCLAATGSDSEMALSAGGPQTMKAGRPGKHPHDQAASSLAAANQKQP
jgi:hypothetical protein